MRRNAPMTGSWVWVGGWLDSLGFYDFAGSTLVHGVGGAAGLACVLLLGARKGKLMIRSEPSLCMGSAEKAQTRP